MEENKRAQDNRQGNGLELDQMLDKLGKDFPAFYIESAKPVKYHLEETCLARATSPILSMSLDAARTSELFTGLCGRCRNKLVAGQVHIPECRQTSDAEVMNDTKENAIVEDFLPAQSREKEPDATSTSESDVSERSDDKIVHGNAMPTEDNDLRNQMTEGRSGIFLACGVGVLLLGLLFLLCKKNR